MPGGVKKEQKESGRIILNGPLFRESDRYTFQIDVSFFFKKIAIQNIHPILNANILKCFNFKTLKHLNIKMLKLRS